MSQLKAGRSTQKSTSFDGIIYSINVNHSRRMTMHRHLGWFHTSTILLILYSCSPSYTGDKFKAADAEEAKVVETPTTESVELEENSTPQEAEDVKLPIEAKVPT